MSPIRVRYFDGRSARAHDAALDFVDGTWTVAGEFGRRDGRPEEVELGERMGASPRLLRWHDGACCEIADHEGLARLLALAGQGESAVQRMQQRWSWALSAIVGVAAALAVVYLYVLPWAAAYIAPAIPPAVTTAMSKQVLETLDQHVLAPSRLAEAKRQAITARLAVFAGGGAPAHRLHFRSAEELGANAFALPSGDIVVLDQLVALADNEDQVVAVIAHELGHVAYHHGMRQLLQSAVVSFVVGVYFGDVSSIAASLGALVLESRYSRDFEFEADRYGAKMLTAGGLSPGLLATMLERLERSHSMPRGDSTKPTEKPAESAADKTAERESTERSLFSTHPETRARIEALRRFR